MSDSSDGDLPRVRLILPPFRRDVSAIPEEPSQIASDELIDECEEEELDEEEESVSLLSTNTTSLSSPSDSNATCSRLENGDPIPRVAVGMFQRRETPGIHGQPYIPTVSEIASARAALVDISATEAGDVNPAGASPRYGDMRGGPPPWMPPNPPGSDLCDPMLPSHSSYEDEDNYEDPEQFPHRSKFASLHRSTSGGGNSYELSHTAQRRSMRDSGLPGGSSGFPSGLSDDDYYLNRPHSILHRNADGAYYVPGGTLSHSGASPLSTSVRYQDERCLPPSVYIHGDPSTASLLHHSTPTGGYHHGSGKRRSSRLMMGTTPLPSTGIVPPLSGSLKKRPPSSTHSSSARSRRRRISPLVLCLGFALLLALGFIVVLLVRVMAPSSASSIATTPAFPSNEELLPGEFPPSGPHALPPEIYLDQKVEAEIPRGEVKTLLEIPSPTRVRFNATLPSGAFIALLGRRESVPSTVAHDFLWKLSDGQLEPAGVDDAELRKRRRRKAHASSEELQPLPSRLRYTDERYLQEGTWHLLFSNANSQPARINFRFDSIPSDSSCEGGCSGKGECRGGSCQCVPGYTGERCEIPACELPCRGHGTVVEGQCKCDRGFKGADCSENMAWCSIETCAHGRCLPSGECACDEGWRGEECREEVVMPTASKAKELPTVIGEMEQRRENTAVEETQRRKEEAPKRDPIPSSTRRPFVPLPPSPSSPSSSNPAIYGDCSQHGVMDTEGACTCAAPWTGIDCQHAICSPACIHGACVSGKCECAKGWKGSTCARRECPIGCSDHGTCTDDGTCVCQEGWNGDNCFQEGCPSGCSAHGECRKAAGGAWSCHCSAPWAGVDCATATEIDCGNGKDDDEDGLTDCFSPACCSSPQCSSSGACAPQPRPSDAAAATDTKDIDGVQGPFLERYRFFLANDLIQKHVAEEFPGSFSSIVRGRLVYRSEATGAMQPLTGARISEGGHHKRGTTLSRNDSIDGDGSFDFLIVGGRSVRLQFMRLPFRKLDMSLYIPPNRVVNIGDIAMGEDRKGLPTATPSPAITRGCKKDRVPPRPEIFEPARLSVGPVTSSSLPSSLPLPYPRVMADSLTVADELPIRGTSLRLVYDSDRVNGTGSRLTMKLTDEKVDKEMRVTHLEIEIAGRRWMEKLAPRPAMSHSFTWDRRDAYGQSLRGLVPVTVRIGYEWRECTEISWTTKRSVLAGAHASDAGWAIDRHHRLDVDYGVLERGDGGRIFLDSRDHWVATVIAGTGELRGPCAAANDCSGFADKLALQSPQSLTSSDDGTIFVVDHDLLRMISPEGTMTTATRIETLTSADPPVSLAIDPTDGSLHYGHSRSRKIFRAVEDKSSQSKRAAPGGSLFDRSTVAGSGDVCPNSAASDGACGDGGDAASATFDVIKDIAFDSAGRMFVADGRRIRVIDSSTAKTRRIRAIGDRTSYAVAGPSPCPSGPFDDAPLSQLRLQWPSSLSVDLATDTLYVVDSGSIFAIRGDVYWVVRGGGCSFSMVHDNATIPRAVAATSDGVIYVLEASDRSTPGTTRIRRIAERGADAEIFTGGLAATMGMKKAGGEQPRVVSRSLLTLSSSTSSIPSMAVDSQGRLLIADAEERKIYRVGPRPLLLDAATSTYRVADAERNEVHFFSSRGLLVATSSLLTGRWIANFTHDGEDRLTRISDGADRTLLTVDYSQPNEQRLASSEGSATILTMAHGQVAKMASPGYVPISFTYTSGGLMATRAIENSPLSFISFSPSGALRELVHDTGERITVEETTGEGLAHSLRSRRSTTTMSAREGRARMERDDQSEWSLRRLGWSGASLSHSAIGRTDLYDGAGTGSAAFADFVGAIPEDAVEGILAVRKSSLRAEKDRSALSSRLEWSTTSKRTERTRRIRTLTRSAKINGYPVLSVTFDREDGVDTWTGPASEPLLRARYARGGEISSIGCESDLGLPSSRRLPLLESSYDGSGRVDTRKWGLQSETTTRDNLGRVTSYTRTSNESKTTGGWTAVYTKEHDWPLSVNFPSTGREFSLSYDGRGLLQEIRAGDEVTSMEVVALGGGHGGELTRRTWQFANKHFLAIRSPHSSLDSCSWREWRSGGGERHAAVERNERGRVTKMFIGDSTIRFAASSSRSKDRVETRREQGGRVITEEIRQRENKSSPWTTASFSVHYDDLLRVATIEGNVHGHAARRVAVTFDPRSHRVTAIGEWKMEENETATTERRGQVILEHRLDAVRLPMLTTLRVGETKAVEVEISRDAFGRPISRSTRLAGEKKEGEEERVEIEYDAAGRPTTWTTNGKRIALSYSSTTGRLTRRGNEAVEWTDAGQVIRAGTDEYEYDASGWVQKRGPLSLAYDSLGRLIGVNEKGRGGTEPRDIRVHYDHRGRVSSFRNGTSLFTLFYAHPERPRRLTHFTRSDGDAPSVLHELLYAEDDGEEGDTRPFAMIRISALGAEEHYTLFYDEIGALFIVVDDVGRVRRKLSHSPLGEVLSDSNSYLFVPGLGWAGGISLPSIGITVVPGKGAGPGEGDETRPWDPRIGRFLSFGPSSILGCSSSIDSLLDPFALPLDSSPLAGRAIPSDIAQWLHLVRAPIGVLERLERREGGDGRRPIESRMRNALEARLGWIQATPSVFSSPLLSSSSSRSPLLPPWTRDDRSFASLLQIASDERNRTTSLQFAPTLTDEERTLLERLLSDSTTIVDIVTGEAGSEERHFASAEQHVPADIRPVSLGSFSVTRSLDSINLQRGSARITVHYGKDAAAAARARLIDEQRRVWTAEAWAEERRAVQTMSPSRTEWSDRARRDIVEKGAIPGWTLQWKGDRSSALPSIFSWKFVEERQ